MLLVSGKIWDVTGRDTMSKRGSYIMRYQVIVRELGSWLFYDESEILAEAEGMLVRAQEEGFRAAISEG